MKYGILKLHSEGPAHREFANGKERIIVQARALPFNSIMNGYLFPAQTIMDNYQKLKGKPVPYGHPRNEDGEPISAQQGEGFDAFMDVWVHDVKIDDDSEGRTGMNIKLAINERKAKSDPEGKEVLAKALKGERQQMSLGIYMTTTDADTDAYDGVAEIHDFDHFAYLPDGVEPAHALEQGTGLNVHGAGDSCQSINTNEIIIFDRFDGILEQDDDDEQDVENFANRVIGKIAEYFNKENDSMSNETNTDKIVDDAVATEGAEANTDANATEDMKAFEEKIATIVEGKVEQVMKPLLEANELLVAEAKAKDEKTRAEAFEKIQKSGLNFSEELCKETPTDVLTFMAENIKKGDAAELSANGALASDDEKEVLSDEEFMSIYEAKTEQGDE